MYLVTRFESEVQGPGGAGIVIDYGGSEGDAKTEPKREKEKKLHALFLSKMVYKQGRVTVAPEDAFRLSGLLPGPVEEDKEMKEVAVWSEGERKRGMEIVEKMLAFERLRDESVGGGDGIVTRSIWG